jgi:hypothetical protein
VQVLLRERIHALNAEPFIFEAQALRFCVLLDADAVGFFARLPRFGQRLRKPPWVE